MLLNPEILSSLHFHIQSVTVGELLKLQEKRDAYVACICAAPIALKSHGVGTGKKLTSHPAVQKEMVDGGETQIFFCIV